MTQVPASSHGGSGGPAAGTYLPVADSSGVTLDTTTYSNPVEGADKIATLVFPLSTAALAMAIAGDAFPRYLFVSNPADGVYLGDGTFDPYNNALLAALSVTVLGGQVLVTIEGGSSTVQVGASDSHGGGYTNLTGNAPRIRFNTNIGITGDTGAPGIGGAVGDLYFRQDGGGVMNTIYRCTVAGGAGAATWVGIL